jgi:hypothetical protein
MSEVSSTSTMNLLPTVGRFDLREASEMDVIAANVGNTFNNRASDTRLFMIMIAEYARAVGRLEKVASGIVSLSNAWVLLGRRRERDPCVYQRNDWRT